MGEEAVFITGAASGIGRATASLFTRKGWRVGLCDRNTQALSQLAIELGQKASAFPVDILDSTGLAAAISKFAEPHGTLKVLFNSAGILDMRPFASTPLEQLNEIIDVNVKGVINAIVAALPCLKVCADSRVVTMGSASGIYGIPELAAYSASKFAIRGLTEALNIELERDGIWVSDIMVGYVRTPMIEEAAHRAKSVEIVGVHVLPETVAETVWSAVHGKQVHWFVSPADAEFAAQIEAGSWQERRDIVKMTTGF